MVLSVQPAKNPTLVPTSSAPKQLSVAPVKTATLVSAQAVAPKPASVTKPAAQSAISQPWAAQQAPSGIINMVNNRGAQQDTSTLPIQGAPTNPAPNQDQSYLHSLPPAWYPPLLPSGDERAYIGTQPPQNIVDRVNDSRRYRKTVQPQQYNPYQQLPSLLKKGR